MAASTGPSPVRTYTVSSSRRGTVAARTSGAPSSLWAITRPSGATIAEYPVGAACRTARSVSSARIRAAATSVAGISSVVYEAAFVGTRSTWPPAVTAARARSEKKTS